MQWDKVKNVLIGILLAVNLFLLGNLGFRLWQNFSRASGDFGMALPSRTRPFSGIIQE